MVEALQQNNVVHSEWGGERGGGERESGMSAGERESGAVDGGKRRNGRAGVEEGG